MSGASSEESPDSTQRIDSFNGEQRVYFVPLRYHLLSLSCRPSSFRLEYSANLNRIRVTGESDSKGLDLNILGVYKLI